MPVSPRLTAFVATAAIVLASLAAPTHAQTSDSTIPYYYNSGRRVPVARSATRLAVRVPKGRMAEAMQQASTLGSVRSVRDIKTGGIVELTVPDSLAPSREIDSFGKQFGGDVLPVFHEPGIERDESTLFISDELLVQFKPGVTIAAIDELNARFGAEFIEPLKYAPNGFKLRVNGGSAARNALTVANAYFETGLCLFSHPNFLAYRSPRLVPNDTQYASRQWHLNNTGQLGGTAGADVKAQTAWDVTTGSPSISIAVADTGIDTTHEDFAGMVGGMTKIHDPRDVVHGDNDPNPQSGDADRSHGTAASGVSTANFNNSLGVAGIAPNCRLIPIQLYAESTFTPNSTEADAFTWAADHGAAVMSNSWGPDNPGTLLPDATRMAMDYATTTGRGGKGMAIFFAAGNSNFNIDLNNNDSYSAYDGVIAVAASTNADRKAGYSSFGPSVSIAAPSSGGSAGITTTDVMGSVGYSSGNYALSFGGTSSACPLAAGVGALVLSVNPNLTWKQLKKVLEDTADKVVDPNIGNDYDANGHSIYFGYGRVNASNAVRLAVAGGPDTPLLYNAGAFFQRNSNTSGNANTTFFYGSGGAMTMPVSGDFNNDGIDSIGTYEPTTGTFFLRNSNSGGSADAGAFPFGPLDCLPIVGDWNGDGTDTIGVYQRSTSTFYLRNSNSAGNGDVQFQFATPNSVFVPIAGDWDGDGFDSIGLYDPNTGLVYLKNANTPGAADATIFFGPGNSWKIFIGDWDNDGKDSLGLQDPMTGATFLRNTNTTGVGDWSFFYGTGGATVTPVAGNFDGQ